jgi:hypothetical protein
MKIDPDVIRALEAETENLTHGEVTLRIIIHDKNARYVLNREISFIPGKPTSGTNQQGCRK